MRTSLIQSTLVRSTDADLEMDLGISAVAGATLSAPWCAVAAQQTLSAPWCAVKTTQTVSAPWCAVKPSNTVTRSIITVAA